MPLTAPTETAGVWGTEVMLGTTAGAVAVWGYCRATSNKFDASDRGLSGVV